MYPSVHVLLDGLLSTFFVYLSNSVYYYVYTTVVGQTVLNQTVLALMYKSCWPGLVQLSFITVYTVRQTGLTCTSPQKCASVNLGHVYTATLHRFLPFLLQRFSFVLLRLHSDINKRFQLIFISNRFYMVT